MEREPEGPSTPSSRPGDERGVPGIPALRRLIPRGAARPAARRPVPHDLDDDLGPRRTIDDVIVDCALYAGGRYRGSAPMDRALVEAKRLGGFVWIGLHEPSADEFAVVASTFGLPELAVEDAVRAHQRPKLERYGDITFVVIKPVRYVDHVEMVDVSELALFVGPGFVIAVRHGSSTIPSRVRTEFQTSDLLGYGPGAVLYRAADLVVDQYMEAIDAINVDVEEIETQVFGGDGEDHAQRIYKLKREILEFRRAVVPFGEPLQVLVDEEVDGVDRRLQPYFRDVHDHLLRAADAIESYDKLLTDVLQADLAQVTVRQNQAAARQSEDVRKISSWAAIALVPTAIAGVYGMNFEHMPELGTRYGYYVVLGAMAGACTALYVMFRRNGWL